MSRRPQLGWGLTETLLTLGAMSAMALAVYAVLGPASASAQVKREQDNLRHLSAAVDQSFGLLGNFSGVSTARVLEDGLAPTGMRSGGDLRTAWGTGVGVHPYAVGGVPGKAFLGSYPLAPAEVCARLASAMARDAFDIRVEGRSVYADGRLDPAIAAEQCGQGSVASMEFVFHSGLVSGQSAVAAPVVLPPSAPTITPPPSTPPVITIPDTPGVDPVEPGTPAVPPPAAPPPVLPPPVASPGTPAPVGAPPPFSNPPPPPVTPPGTVCEVPATQTRRVRCPAGQAGQVDQQRVGYCADEPGGRYEAWQTPRYDAWTETGRTCAACPAPSTETATRWTGTTGSCPSGTLGTHTWERQQRRQRSVSYACESSPWTQPGPTYGTWSPWNNTGSIRNEVNTCEAVCVAPSPETETRTRTNCPAGQVGTITEQRTTTYACPAPTGLPTSTTSGWSVVSNTCSAVCVAPAPTTTAITRLATPQTRDACPAGYTGSTPQIRTGTEAGTRTTTWACPSPTGSPTSTTRDTWSGTYTWGAWTASGADTCAAPPPACVLPIPSRQSDYETQKATRRLDCPAGQVGDIFQERQERRERSRPAVCPAPTGDWVWGAWTAWSAWQPTSDWTETSNTCKPSTIFICECTGNMYVGGGFVNSFGTFPDKAACEAARGGSSARECVSEITRFPQMPGASCYHLLGSNWMSAPRTNHCAASSL